jgi:excisionase family DNA binding protein
MCLEFSMNDTMSTKPYTIFEAAQELAISESQVRRLIDAEQLRAFNSGCALKRHWRIPAEEITRFIEARTNTSGS